MSLRRKRSADELRQSVCGEKSDAGTEHHVTRYSWWNSHEGSSTTQADQRFLSKRSALLYCAKCNTEELRPHIGHAWQDYFEGVYALHPNEPFALERFIELSDEDLSTYVSELCNAFSRLKIVQGTVFRYVCKQTEIMGVDELIEVLQSTSSKLVDHAARQKELLSNVAGFD